MKESHLHSILAYIVIVGAILSDNFFKSLLLLVIGFVCCYATLLWRYKEKRIDEIRNSNELLKFRTQLQILEQLKKLNEVKKRGLSKKR